MNKKIIIIVTLLSFLFVDSTIAYFKKIDPEGEVRAIYISYLEYLDNFCGYSKKINQAKIDKMVENIKMLNFNWIILHVSPFSDAIYNSSDFPYSYTLTSHEGKNPGFDYLEYFIKKAHQLNIKVHAWINPYRIRLDQDSQKISESNPAYVLLNTSHVMSNKTGIYYNPASELVKNLIINQVKEIINNYDVDGIHFDDYFYMQNEIDQKEYQNYVSNGGKMSLSEFRLNHTNDLIRRVYHVIKSFDEQIIFSISPDGNINNNYKYHYADIKTWLSNDGYVDIIMPQLYYGYNNEYRPYIKALAEWQNLITNPKIKMIPVLAFYKTGNIDEQAGKGKSEWVNNEDVIKRQITDLRERKTFGVALFRYDFLFNNNYLNNTSQKELLNMRMIM